MPRPAEPVLTPNERELFPPCYYPSARAPRFPFERRPLASRRRSATHHIFTATCYVSEERDRYHSAGPPEESSPASAEQFPAPEYAPGEEPSAFMLLAYADALVTMEVLRLAGDNPTREGVLDVLANEMEGYDANGLLVPLKWSGDQHVGVQGISLDLITDGAFVRVNEYFEPGE